jgi:hypothetical protein
LRVSVPALFRSAISYVPAPLRADAAAAAKRPTPQLGASSLPTREAEINEAANEKTGLLAGGA